MNTTKKETAHWFKFLPAEFLADINVCAMTAQEVGIYWLLICYCWREVSLPNNHEHLAALTRVSVEEFDTAWERRVKQCFTLDEQGQWVSPWLEEVRAEKAEFQAQRQRAAHASWESRRRTTKGKRKLPLRDSKVVLSQHANAHAKQAQSTPNADAMPIQNNTVQEQHDVTCEQISVDVVTHKRGEGSAVPSVTEPLTGSVPSVTAPLPPSPPSSVIVKNKSINQQ